MNKITSLDLFVKLLEKVNCPAHTEAPMELVRYMFEVNNHCIRGTWPNPFILSKIQERLSLQHFEKESINRSFAEFREP